MSFYNKFPSKQELLSSVEGINDEVINVNAHLHTPYSFSAFSSINQAVELAKNEDVKVIGINDFYSTDGYEKWEEACTKRKLFPLFNIEFIGLSKEEQDNSTRINDPGNPGRIYLSGKGLSYPFKLEEPFHSQLEEVKKLSNEQVKLMCDKLNKHLQNLNLDFSLSFPTILSDFTEGMIRERHLAKALRLKVFEVANSEQDRKALLGKIFNAEVKSDINNSAAIENEIRGALLKSGGAAFIPEDPKSFLPMETLRQIIIKSGGIPTYPLLANDKNGNFTDFEQNKEALAKTLKERGFFSVEFITIRNTEKVLEEYAQFFVDEGFAVSFGTEHNTPELTPLKLYTTDKSELSQKLKTINYEGACIIAAHQYLVANGEPGFINSNGEQTNNRKELIQLGKALINNTIN